MTPNKSSSQAASSVPVLLVEMLLMPAILEPLARIAEALPVSVGKPYLPAKTVLARADLILAIALSNVGLLVSADCKTA